MLQFACFKLYPEFKIAAGKRNMVKNFERINWQAKSRMFVLYPYSEAWWFQLEEGEKNGICYLKQLNPDVIFFLICVIFQRR